jgi:hypothetical protein
MILPPPCFTIGIVTGFLQTWSLEFRPKSSILVSSDHRILFLMVCESLGTFWQTPSGLSCAFYWGVVSFCPLYHKGLIGGVLQRWCLSGKFSHLHRGTLELCQWFLVTSLKKALLPRLLSLAGQPALGWVLVVPNFFHLRMIEGTVFLGTFHATDMYWYPSPVLCLDTILSRGSTDNSFDLMAWFLHWHRNIKNDQWKPDAPELNFEAHSKGSEYLCK